MNEEEKLVAAVNALFDSLTVDWSDNGNILADAVRDSVIATIGRILEIDSDSVHKKVDALIECRQ